MNTKISKNQAKFETLINALTVIRTDSDCKAVSKKLTMHIVDYCAQYKIDFDQLVKTVSIKPTPRGTPDASGFIAQKAVVRALELIQGIGSGVLPTVPVEVQQVLIGLMKSGANAVPNLYPQALLSRFIENDDISDLMTKYQTTHKMRAPKAPSTAQAQGSSVKGMLRGLGIGAGIKHGRTYGEIDLESPLMTAFASLVASKVTK